MKDFLNETTMDRVMTAFVCAMLLMSFSFLASAAEHLVDERNLLMLVRLNLFMTIPALGLFLLVLLIFITWNLKNKRAVFQADSYVVHSFRRSGLIAFVVTFFALNSIQHGLDSWFGIEMPMRFYIDLVKALGVAVFSLTFIYQVHGGKDEAVDLDSAL